REHNRTIQLNDPTAHAEILLLRKTALIIGNYRLSGVTVYVTVEPCPMCAGALIQGRIDQLVFGAPDQKGGGVVSKFSILEPGKLNHDISILSGILDENCREIMKSFFNNRR
ncbi:MAG: nucleoside deaminase, partial [Acidobacteriota bacterium]